MVSTTLYSLWLPTWLTCPVQVPLIDPGRAGAAGLRAVARGAAAAGGSTSEFGSGAVCASATGAASARLNAAAQNRVVLIIILLRRIPVPQTQGSRLA